MTKVCAVILLLACVATFTSGQNKVAVPPQPGPSEREVRKLEREWLDAYERHDAEAMNRIVADDFTITFPNGDMQNKARIIASLKAPVKGTQTTYKFHTEDVESRAYGNTVILIGRVITQSQQEGGKTLREESRYTDTYVKRQGRWQVVASHLSNVAKPRQ
jgi:uncharacterized protein (TIGR02246 family)